VRQVVLGAPEASVDVHDYWERTFALGESKLAELVGLGAIGKTDVSWRWRESENVFRRHVGYCQLLVLSQFHDRTLSPFVFLAKEIGDRAMQLGLGLTRYDADAGAGSESPSGSSNLHVGICF
jgi:hypothetical protein